MKTVTLTINGSLSALSGAYNINVERDALGRVTEKNEGCHRAARLRAFARWLETGKRMNDYQQLAEAVGKAVVAALAATLREPLLTDRLWTAQNCADYLCVSRSDFYRIAANPTFPEPAVDLNRGGKLSVRRWKPKDVMRWRGF